MSYEVAIDNDILIKCSCFDFLRELPDGPAFLILGAARFVVEHELATDPVINDPTNARSRFQDFLKVASTLEPTPEEVKFATELEEAAATYDLPLDTGESQLCAIATLRALSLVVTGDKRAITALERMTAHVPRLRGLEQRLVCLEQLVLGLISAFGVPEMRERVCKEPLIDKAMSICFSCATEELDASSVTDGLRSYVSDLRRQAATVLHEQDAVTVETR
jgi:hypothetical protein